MSLSRHLDMPGVLTEIGVRVANVIGDEVWAWCPNDDHEERKPEHWSINTESGEHLCFSCGYSGTLPMLVAEKLGLYRAMRMPDGSRVLDLKAAGTWIRDKGMSLDALQKLPSWEKEQQEFVPAMGEALLAVYEQPPWSEMERRGLEPDSVDAFGVLWDAKEDTWILPVRDPYDASLWGWQVKGAGVFRNYPVGIKKSRTLFGLNVFEGGRALLVESPLDAVRLDSAGITGGLATFGASISEHQMRLVLEVADEIIVATDNFGTDPAGRKAALQLLQRYSRRIPMRFLNYSKALDQKDPGEMTDEQIHWAVDNAKHAWRGKKAVA